MEEIPRDIPEANSHFGGLDHEPQKGSHWVSDWCRAWVRVVSGGRRMGWKRRLVEFDSVFPSNKVTLKSCGAWVGARRKGQ